MTSLLTTIQTSTINGNVGSTLTIGNNLTTNPIQIGTSTNAVIGGANTTTTIGGTLTTSTINGVTGSTLAIGNNLTTEAIEIGQGGTTTTVKGTLQSSGGNGDIVSLSNGKITLTRGGLILSQCNITLPSGEIPPIINQLGYIKKTTSVNTINSFSFNRVRFTGDINCFSDNDGGSLNYGLLITPGTWLIQYNILFRTDTATVNWIYKVNSNITYNPTVSVIGTQLGGQDGYTFNQAANSGFSLNNTSFVYLSGSIIEQIPLLGGYDPARYYNVRASIRSFSESGNLSISGSNLTAVRIA